MKPFILINKNNGELGVAARVSFFDKHDVDNEIAVLGDYSVGIIPSKQDGWIVSQGDAWFFINNEMFEKSAVEILCEL